MLVTGKIFFHYIDVVVEENFIPQHVFLLHKTLKYPSEKSFTSIGNPRKTSRRHMNGMFTVKLIDDKRLHKENYVLRGLESFGRPKYPRNLSETPPLL
jgi:hypothetical protein